MPHSPPHNKHHKTGNHNHHNHISMEHVKIKRVKRNKKKATTKEKILAGLGVGGALMGVASVSPKTQATKFVRTQTQEAGSKKSKVKDTLKRIFGVSEAKAADPVQEAQDALTAAQNAYDEADKAVTEAFNNQQVAVDALTAAENALAQDPENADLQQAVTDAENNRNDAAEAANDSLLARDQAKSDLDQAQTDYDDAVAAANSAGATGGGTGGSTGGGTGGTTGATTSNVTPPQDQPVTDSGDTGGTTSAPKINDTMTDDSKIRYTYKTVNGVTDWYADPGQDKTSESDGYIYTSNGQGGWDLKDGQNKTENGHNWLVVNHLWTDQGPIASGGGTSDTMAALDGTVLHWDASKGAVVDSAGNTYHFQDATDGSVGGYVKDAIGTASLPPLAPLSNLQYDLVSIDNASNSSALETAYNNAHLAINSWVGLEENKLAQWENAANNAAGTDVNLQKQAAAIVQEREAAIQHEGKDQGGAMQTINSARDQRLAELNQQSSAMTALDGIVLHWDASKGAVVDSAGNTYHFQDATDGNVGGYVKDAPTSPGVLNLNNLKTIEKTDGTNTWREGDVAGYGHLAVLNGSVYDSAGQNISNKFSAADLSAIVQAFADNSRLLPSEVTTGTGTIAAADGTMLHWDAVRYVLVDTAGKTYHFEDGKGYVVDVNTNVSPIARPSIAVANLGALNINLSPITSAKTIPALDQAVKNTNDGIQAWQNSATALVDNWQNSSGVAQYAAQDTTFNAAAEAQKVLSDIQAKADAARRQVSDAETKTRTALSATTQPVTTTPTLSPGNGLPFTNLVQPGEFVYNVPPPPPNDSAAVAKWQKDYLDGHNLWVATVLADYQYKTAYNNWLLNDQQRADNGLTRLPPPTPPTGFVQRNPGAGIPTPGAPGATATTLSFRNVNGGTALGVGDKWVISITNSGAPEHTPVFAVGGIVGTAGGKIKIGEIDANGNFQLTLDRPLSINEVGSWSVDILVDKTKIGDTLNFTVQSTSVKTPGHGLPFANVGENPPPFVYNVPQPTNPTDSAAVLAWTAGANQARTVYANTVEADWEYKNAYNTWLANGMRYPEPPAPAGFWDRYNATGTTTTTTTPSGPTTFTGGTVSGVATGFTFTNVTAGDTATLAVGDKWHIEVSGPAGQKAFVTGGQNGQVITTEMGIIGSNNKFTLDGSITADQIGAWSESWFIGADSSHPSTSFPTFTFTVVATRPAATTTTTPPAGQTTSIAAPSITATEFGTDKTTLIITGTGFNSNVYYNSVEFVWANGTVTGMSPSGLSGGKLTVKIPQNLQPGTYQVRVLNLQDTGFKRSNSLSVTLTSANFQDTSAVTVASTQVSKNTVSLIKGATDATAIVTVTMSDGSTNHNVTVSSSDSGKVTAAVNTATGAITFTGVNTGTATITVHPANLAATDTSQDKTITVTVTAPATSAARQVAAISVGVGSSVGVDLTADVTSANSTVSSSNSAKATATINSSGIVTVTGVSAGTATITIHPKNLASSDTSQDLTIAVEVVAATAAAPVFATSTLPDAQVGTAYSLQLQASGGSGSLVYTLTSGNLPDGLVMNSQGLITGMPNIAASYNFQITVTDAAGQATAKTFSLRVAPANTGSGVVISSATLPVGLVGSSYSYQIQASGSGTLSFAATGTLPPGLSMSTAGLLSGTPTAAGNYSFSIRVTDAGGQTANKTLSIAIGTPVDNSGGGSDVSNQITQLQQQIAGLQARLNALNAGGTTVINQGNSQDIVNLQSQINRLQDLVNRYQNGAFRGLQYDDLVRAQTGGGYIPSGLQMPPGYPASDGYIAPAVEGARAQAKQYTVKKGDTLWAIAKKYYGSGNQWRKILSANPNCLSRPGNTKTLKIGFVLAIPQ